MALLWMVAEMMKENSVLPRVAYASDEVIRNLVAAISGLEDALGGGSCGGHGACSVFK